MTDPAELELGYLEDVAEWVEAIDQQAEKTGKPWSECVHDWIARRHIAGGPPGELGPLSRQLEEAEANNEDLTDLKVDVAKALTEGK